MPNQKLVREALKSLPEGAILELAEEEELRDWIVLRVADEILVDLMTAACGVRYIEAEPEIQQFEVETVSIPFASPRLMMRLKQTHRAKDEEDRIFLHWKIAQENGAS